MTPLQVIFILISIMTLGSAVMVVTVKNLVHAALWLVLSLFGIAVYFVIMDASFFAVAQVVIYIGAIAILMIFAIMLTRKVAQDTGSQINSGWAWAACISVVFFAVLIWLVNTLPASHSTMPKLDNAQDSLQKLGEALISPNAYAIPFEIASVLLVAALIGAIMIAWDRD